MFLAFFQLIITAIILVGAIAIGMFVWKNASQMHKQIYVSLIVVVACILEIISMHLLGVVK